MAWSPFIRQRNLEDEVFRICPQAVGKTKREDQRMLIWRKWAAIIHYKLRVQQDDIELHNSRKSSHVTALSVGWWRTCAFGGAPRCTARLDVERNCDAPPSSSCEFVGQQIFRMLKVNLRQVRSMLVFTESFLCCAKKFSLCVYKFVFLFPHEELREGHAERLQSSMRGSWLGSELAFARRVETADRASPVSDARWLALHPRASRSRPILSITFMAPV